MKTFVEEHHLQEKAIALAKDPKNQERFKKLINDPKIQAQARKIGAIAMSKLRGNSSKTTSFFKKK